MKMASTGDGSDLTSDVQHAVVRLKELGKEIATATKMVIRMHT